MWLRLTDGKSGEGVAVNTDFMRCMTANRAGGTNVDVSVGEEVGAIIWVTESMDAILNALSSVGPGIVVRPKGQGT